MADLSPIIPLLYNQQIVGDLSSVITPPYDVISPAQQAEYRKRSPYSAIHIELPLAEGALDPYRHAASLVRSWKHVGVLQPHEPAAFFVHKQNFSINGQPYSRTALLAGVRLAEWSEGVVIPHEHTMSGPKRDRLQLFQATALAPSTLFGLYYHSEVVENTIKDCTSREPIRMATENGIAHTLWAIDEADSVKTIAEQFRDKKIYIADGHHRYETSLAYRDEQRQGERKSETCSYNYVAMSLVAFDDPGLVVLPTHRLVSGVPREAAERLPEVLGQTMHVELIESWQPNEESVDDLLATGGEHVYLIYDGSALRKVTAGKEISQQLPTDRSDAWKQLDLAVLHEVVLGQALGMVAGDTERHIVYTRDVPEAFEQVNAGTAQVACFVRPTSVAQLRAVADASDKMPEKSTYFYPKFPAGLVINQLDVELPPIEK